MNEDLGGGLKAIAVLESGLSADTGALGQGGLAFGRQAFVGLSSASLGEVRLGRQYILSDSTMGMSNPFGKTPSSTTRAPASPTRAVACPSG